MKRLLTKSILGLVFVLLISTAVQAEVPHVINYQGQLSDSTGAPLDTTVDITFTIYDDNNPGAVAWSETQTVTVVGGLFNVVLGTGGGLNFSVFADSARSLGIQVGLDPELTPLVKLTSVGYSFHADYADNAGSANTALSADNADHADSADIAAAAYLAESSIYSDTAAYATTIADDAVDNDKIINGSIFFEDIGQNGAAAGQVIKWNGAAWVADNDISGGATGWTDDGNVVRLETSNDSVGIGTSSPSEKLEVSGNIKATGTIQSGSSIVINGTSDQITASSGTISFDDDNLNTNGKATIGAGHTNSGAAAFVAGDSNTVSGGQSNVSGGKSNTAGGQYSGVGGGYLNVASGTAAIVSGGRFNKARGDYSFVGAGGGVAAFDSNSAVGNYTVVTGGARNKALSPYSTIGGGFSNTTSHTDATVSGGTFNTASGDNSTVGGGSGNTATGINSAVAGGTSNHATSTATTVSGGQLNNASGQNASVGGGYDNDATGGQSVVSGGIWNRASGDYSVVAGGGGFSGADSNQAGGDFSIVSGGRRNRVTGNYSIIGGGYGCTVSGRNSYAAGTNASVAHHGSFAWADSSTNSTLSSSADNQFTVRSAGGARFFSNSALTTGVTMAAGGGSWSSVSDSTVKENINEINGDEILEKLSKIKISKWNYRAQDQSIQHIGPMAQDFFKAFGVGEDERHITTLDADGVALAAIKALYKENQDLKKRLEKLEKMILESSKN